MKWPGLHSVLVLRAAASCAHPELLERLRVLPCTCQLAASCAQHAVGVIVYSFRGILSHKW